MMRSMCSVAGVVLSILIAGLACGGSAAVACSYDGIASAAALAKFKKAAEVAAALRSPSAAPVIERQTGARPLPSMVGFHRAVRRLQGLREALEQTVLERRLQAPAIALLLVEFGALDALHRGQRGRHDRDPRRRTAAVRRSGLHRRSRDRGDHVGAGERRRSFPPRPDRGRRAGKRRPGGNRVAAHRARRTRSPLRLKARKSVSPWRPAPRAARWRRVQRSAPSCRSSTPRTWRPAGSPASCSPPSPGADRTG